MVVMPFTGLPSSTTGMFAALAWRSSGTTPSSLTGVMISTSTPLAMKSSAAATCLATSRLASCTSTSMPSSAAWSFMPLMTFWYHSCVA